MKTREVLRSLFFVALVGFCSNPGVPAVAQDLAAVESWTCHTEKSDPHNFTIRRGETRIIETAFVDKDDHPKNFTNVQTVVFRSYPGDPATNDWHYDVTGAVYSVTGAVSRITWNPSDEPSDSRLVYEIAVCSATQTLCKAFGILTLQAGIGDAGATGGTPRRVTSIDWSTVEQQNTGDSGFVTSFDLGRMDVAEADIVAIEALTGGWETVRFWWADNTGAVAYALSRTDTWNQASTDGIDSTNRLYRIEALTGGWETVRFWASDYTSGIAYALSRTGTWDTASTDATAGTNWMAAWTAAVASAIGRTGTWNQASTDGIDSTNRLYRIEALTGGWETVRFWASDYTSGIAYALSRTGTWDTASTDATAGTNWMAAWTAAVASAIGRTGTWNQASTDGIDSTNRLYRIEALTGGWETVRFWASDYTSGIAYALSRTGTWDTASTDATAGTNWMAAWTAAVASAIGRTGTWNQASTDGIDSTNRLYRIEALTGGWETVRFWASDYTSGIAYALSRTGTWDTASSDATAGTNWMAAWTASVASAIGRTGTWNQASADGIDSTNRLYRIEALTGGWETVRFWAADYTSGIAYALSRTSIWNQASIDGINASNRLDIVEPYTNEARAAYGWGNHADAGYLTGGTDEFRRVTIADTGFLGAELTTNGTFTGSAAGWILTDASYGANKVQITFGETGIIAPSNTLGLTVGRLYRVTFARTTSDSGETITLVMGGQTNTWAAGDSGTLSATVFASTTNDPVLTVATFSDSVYIDTISIKQVLAGDLRSAGSVWADNYYLQGIPLTNTTASLQAQVSSNDADISFLQSQITSNDTDISVLQTGKCSQVDFSSHTNTPIISAHPGAGSASTNNSGDFATSTQGTRADTVYYNFQLTNSPLDGYMLYVTVAGGITNVWWGSPSIPAAMWSGFPATNDVNMAGFSVTNIGTGSVVFVGGMKIGATPTAVAIRDSTNSDCVTMGPDGLTINRGTLTTPSMDLNGSSRSSWPSYSADESTLRLSGTTFSIAPWITRNLDLLWYEFWCHSQNSSMGYLNGAGYMFTDEGGITASKCAAQQWNNIGYVIYPWSVAGSGTESAAGALGVNLVGHFKLNDNAANTVVVDSSGNGYDQTAPKNTSLMSGAGVVNNAFLWDGSTDRILSYTAQLNPQYGGYAFWIKFNDFVGTDGGLEPFQSYGNAFTFDVVSSGALTIYITGEGAPWAPMGTLVTNVWYHFAVVLDTAGIRYFKNGVCVKTNTVYTSGFDPYGSTFSFGGSLVNTYKLNGAMDDIRVYTTSVSNEVIAALAANSPGCSATNMVLSTTNKVLTFVPVGGEASAYLSIGTNGTSWIDTSKLTLAASRDGGTSWTTGSTVYAAQTVGGTNAIVVSTLSVTNQPSGSNVLGRLWLSTNAPSVTVLGINAPMTD